MCGQYSAWSRTDRTISAGSLRPFVNIALTTTTSRADGSCSILGALDAVFRPGEDWWVLGLLPDPDEPLPLLPWKLVPSMSVMRRWTPWRKRDMFGSQKGWISIKVVSMQSGAARLDGPGRGHPRIDEKQVGRVCLSQVHNYLLWWCNSSVWLQARFRGHSALRDKIRHAHVGR